MLIIFICALYDKEAEYKLIEKAKKRDSRAYEQLIKNYERQLVSFARTICGKDSSVAADILQEALLKAYTNINQFRGEKPFISWLFSIVRNQFKDYIKSPATRGDITMNELSEEIANSDSAFDAEIILEERKNNLMMLIATLPDNYKEAIVLVDLQGLNYTDAAEIAGISQEALKTRIFRARSELAEIVKNNLKLFK